MKRLSKSRLLPVGSLTELPRSFVPFLPARIVLDLATGPALGAASPTSNVEPLASDARFPPLVRLPAAIRWAVMELMVTDHRR